LAPVTYKVVNYSAEPVLLLLTILITIAAIISLSPNVAIGQNSNSNNNSVNRTTTQLWIDKEYRIKIQFAYLPEKPIMGMPTELMFIIQNLQTGSNLKNITASLVIVTYSNSSSGQEKISKFTNINAPNGDFSVKYLFPDWGIYQVISRIHSKDVSALASFKVLVPVQPVGIIDTNYLTPLLLPAGLVGIIGAIFVIAFLIIIKKMKNEK
jgi:hypothetical protein